MFFDAGMPLPYPDEDTKEFWDGCNRERLQVQRCAACGAWRFAPGPVCYQCWSMEYEYVTSRGQGEVFSWTISYREVHPATRGAVPYNTVVVRLDDCGGAMVTSNLVDVNNEHIYAGMPVGVVWERVSETIVLPRFRPLDPGQASKPLRASPAPGNEARE
jgi:uncharacterized protein